MEISQIIPHIEALIFASDKPLTSIELTEYVNNALGFIEDRANLDQVESAIEGIREKYNSEFYAFELKQSGGGWQFLTKAEYHTTVALINGDKFIKKLSTAALETLAIIAYKQPVTKSEMESIRGVNCDYAVQKLLEKDLVIISGRNEDAVGKPLIYATSKSFMDYFGINSADDLPKINEVLMEEYAKATSISELMGFDEAAEESTEQNISPELAYASEEVVIAATEEQEEMVITDDEEYIIDDQGTELTVEALGEDEAITTNEEQEDVVTMADEEYITEEQEIEITAEASEENKKEDEEA